MHFHNSYLLLYLKVKFSTYALALLFAETVMRTTMVSPAANGVAPPVWHAPVPKSVVGVVEFQVLTVPLMVASALQLVNPPVLVFLNMAYFTLAFEVLSTSEMSDVVPDSNSLNVEGSLYETYMLYVWSLACGEVQR
ncbi:MAG: hypothetical protein WBP23_01005 [Candidatus Saccharimonadales bacterium]